MISASATTVVFSATTFVLSIALIAVCLGRALLGIVEIVMEIVGVVRACAGASGERIEADVETGAEASVEAGVERDAEARIEFAWLFEYVWLSRGGSIDAQRAFNQKLAAEVGQHARWIREFLRRLLT